MYKRKEVIGDCTLYLGDCLEVMPNIELADHVICDPPYEKEAHIGNRRTKENGRAVQNALTFDSINEDTRDGFVFEVSRLCCGWFIAFCQAEGIAPYRDVIEKYGMKYKKPMIWVKPDELPQLNGQGPGMGWESLVVS